MWKRKVSLLKARFVLFTKKILIDILHLTFYYMSNSAKHNSIYIHFHKIKFDCFIKNENWYSCMITNILYKL